MDAGDEKEWNDWVEDEDEFGGKVKCLFCGAENDRINEDFLMHLRNVHKFSLVDEKRAKSGWLCLFRF
jgi:hypothetical protein